MAEFKPVRVSKGNLDAVDKVNGQLIFEVDTTEEKIEKICLDVSNESRITFEPQSEIGVDENVFVFADDTLSLKDNISLSYALQGNPGNTFGENVTKGNRCLGDSNTISGGSYNIAIGARNSISTGIMSILVGQDLESTKAYPGKLYLGMWNDDDSSSNYIFCVGCGSSSERKNAFSVDPSGKVIVGDKQVVNGDIEYIWSGKRTTAGSLSGDLSSLSAELSGKTSFTYLSSLFADGNNTTIEKDTENSKIKINVSDSVKGDKGDNGESVVVSIDEGPEGVHNVTFTVGEDAKTIVIKDGEKGEKGDAIEVNTEEPTTGVHKIIFGTGENAKTIELSDGSKGDKGDKGDKGEATKWFSGTQVYGTSTWTGIVEGSNEGDWYVNTDNFNIYLKSHENSWGYKGNIKGEQGVSAQWLSGTQVYGTSTWNGTVENANVGDWYINISNYNIYQFISGNSWAYKGNIKGAQGSVSEAEVKGWIDDAVSDAVTEALGDLNSKLQTALEGGSSDGN